ncbi:unnamed protein product [Owenia fusiformis]|uniref:CAP-Gly domain-containing protein n=1 Tax=Owenia fusiformis TaxID=6347 RepID=A0A8S4NEW1_OWEFU|nr:unnamed protein product [Owenia fusiformis]
MSARSRSASPSGRSKSKDPSPPVDLPPDVMTENIPIIAKYDTPGGPTGDPLEEVAQHLFNKMNTANDGKLTPKEVEMFFKCPSMKAMSKQDTKKLRSFIKWKKKSIPVENLVPLARELMRLQYNIPGAVEILSNEEGELCHWVEVHLGKHTFYFNKQTTDATYKMPEEYFSSLDTTLFYDGVLHLLRLELEGSEDDMELPFEELIRMIQGGLTLSDKDLKAILKQCKKTKENSMAPKEFIPFVRRQIMEAYENKKAMPTDWCPMVSPRYGTFFYNKKTGQVSQNTPEELLKHHHSMVDRKETIAAGLKKALEEKAEVIEELENERKLKQELEETLEDMQLQANKLNRDMNKSNSSLEKSRQEGQKKDVNIEKLERDKTVMEQKIKDLEIRASEADKLDREVDKVRGQLDASQQNTRERDHEIRQLQSTLASTQKELEVAKEKIHMQNEKILDLRAQVREELARNEKVEKNLDTIPRLKDRIETQDEEIKTVKKQLEEKTYQVQWCRKNVKETKEKTKQNDFDYVEHVKLAREDEVIKSENVTLKGLLRGKDILIVQKSQELDLARSILTELENDEDEDFAWRVQEVKERRCRLHPTFGDNNNGNEGTINGDNTSMKEVKVQQYRKPQQKGGKSGKIDINNPPFALSNSTSESSDNWEHNHKQQTHRHESKFLEDVLLDNSDNDEQDAFMYTRNQSSPRESTDYNQNKRSPRSGSEIKRPKTAFARTTQYRTDRDFREDRNLGKSYDSDRDHRRSKTEPIRRPHSVNSDVKTVSSLMTLYDEDTLKSQFVNMGDRVLIKLPQAKSKQQGKGKGSQGCEMPQVAGGIVKYVGEMDDNTNSHRIRVGVKMDDTVGDTDGMFKGKRYFFVPKDHGRIVKISNVISVLDTKTAKYKPMKQCVKELLSDAITDVQPAHED